MRWTIALALVALSGLPAGCGRHPVPTAGGAAVFAGSCSSCHSLIGNESLRRQGGDLLGYHFTRAELLEFAGEMPARKPLSAPQLAAVVDYVLQAERHPSAGGH